MKLISKTSSYIRPITGGITQVHITEGHRIKDNKGSNIWGHTTTEGYITK